MNINDPSLYSVTPREMTTYPYAWQNVPRFVPPFQAYGMHPFQSFGLQSFLPYGMQPIYPFGQLNNPFYAPLYPNYPNYGAQAFVPPTFMYGYNTPFQTPLMSPQAGTFGLPCFPGMQGWQKPLY